MDSIGAGGSFTPPSSMLPFYSWRVAWKFTSKDSYIFNLVLHFICYNDSCTFSVLCRYNMHRWEQLQRTLHIFLHMQCMHCTVILHWQCTFCVQCASTHGQKLFTVCNVHLWVHFQRTTDAQCRERCTWTEYCAPGAPYRALIAYFTCTLQCTVIVQCDICTRCTVQCTYSTRFVQIAVCGAFDVHTVHQVHQWVLL